MSDRELSDDAERQIDYLEAHLENWSRDHPGEMMIDVTNEEKLEEGYWKRRVEAEIAWQVSLSKSEWITAARAKFNPGKQESCTICNQLPEITHAHHLVPLEEKFERRYERPSHEFVWLCPNHHALVHLFIRDPYASQDVSLGDSEIEAIDAIAEKAEEWPK